MKYTARGWRNLERALDENPGLASVVRSIGDAKFWEQMIRAARRKHKQTEKAADQMALRYQDEQMRQRAAMLEFELALKRLGPDVVEYVE